MFECVDASQHDQGLNFGLGLRVQGSVTSAGALNPFSFMFHVREDRGPTEKACLFVAKREKL